MKSLFSTGAGLSSLKVCIAIEWKRYTGYSYLFDNPGNCLVSNDAKRLSNDDSVAIYNWLWAGMERIGGDELISRHLLFPLPRNTYHVTVWDGINIENIENIVEPYKTELEEFFSGLPSSIGGKWPGASPSCQFEEHVGAAFTIKFRLRPRPLYLRGKTVLAADLEPCEGKSRALYRTINKARNDLDEQFLERYGKPKNAGFVPYVALGYFADPEIAESAWGARREEWGNIFSDVGEQEIEFRSIGLYAFTDMVSYYRDRAIEE